MIKHSLPKKIFSAAQCRSLDRKAIEQFGIPGYQLMQRAAQALMALIRQRWPMLHSLSIWVGGGNNGGDGLVLARLAYEAGWQVQLLIPDQQLAQRLTGEAAEAWRDLPEQILPEVYTAQTKVSADLIVDALLGIGVRGEVREPLRAMIERINREPCPVLAVDVPSGLDSDSGQVLGAAVKADITLTFIANKLGWLTGQGSQYAGQRYWASLGLSKELFTQEPPLARLTQDTDLAELLPVRSRVAHKGDFGVVLVIGGNRGMGGAAIMAAEAALRGGAGRVVLASRSETVMAALARVPEVMSHSVSGAVELTPLLAQASVVVVGPGLGRDDWSRELLTLALAADVPKVVDADALNLLADGGFQLTDGAILTPHPGEASRLLQLATSQLQSDRLGSVRAIAKRYGAVALLKGAGTLVSDGDLTYVCDRGNPGMASAGMGDLLSGIIAALLAQGLSRLNSARLAVYIHACAADLAAESGERGLFATDLLAKIRQVINPKGIN